ncbi:KUP system potassium uptake protein [Arachidicoccus rhizosphaerae]|uniref:Probable potassium transport system protein Kup n=1 Tax=Arachidicoccus rhizosphaerae TaxID=551991 RepID=A0A1H3XGL4_9BACT|nr:KUP/HAK/KT family potassium transporter [Arachidicoccus rhizosphaerae]SDZ97698.1 KUP system potassium uptake protein [Arachidicoccus rhizosphaerae]
MSKNNINKVSLAGLVIALGIIYGDIGTSPLYVLKAILNHDLIPSGRFPELIIGGISCIIWTLTLQTTIKYVVLTLRADNRGEGGIFSLYALVRRQKKWLVVPAMIGGAALLADGIITPPVTVTSAIEGLELIPAFAGITREMIVLIVMSIICVLFFMQQFGTYNIGKMFGPIMLAWFVMMALLGGSHLMDNLGVLKAFNPYYAIRLLIDYPGGFWLLGAVFLCTTGAEALYSDLGHCGRKNIYVTWVFVKICLIMNYLGQGSWLLAQYKEGQLDLGRNPFFAVMPDSFRLVGILIATAAAVIASQALISGSFTLISEALRLNLWPKMKIKYPSEEKGQVYIPGINTLLWIGCLAIVLHFQESSKMEAAYGLAITLCMISTSILFANYLIGKRIKKVWVALYLLVYLVIELSFLGANLNKFPHGGYVAIIVGGILFGVMYVWFRSRKIKNRYVEFVRLEHYVPMIQELSNDKTIPMYSTHLVYMTSANNPKEIEHKIIYSILNRKPKRADIYWFVHVDIVDDPYTTEFIVEHIIPNDIIRVEFRLGFRVEQKIQLMMKRVVEELYANKEVNITSRYESLERNNISGDFQFVVLEKFLSNDNELPFFEKLIMRYYFWLKKISLGEEKGFGLDSSYVQVEKFPLIVSPTRSLHLKRIYPEGEE